LSRPANLAKLSVADLNRELKRRRHGGQSLLRKRTKLMEKVHALDARLRELGMSAGGVSSGGPRPRNESNLVEALSSVLKGKTMSVTEVSEAVQKSGYQTTSPNFRTIVNQALIVSGKFKKISRGQYTAK
jgi:chorismate synthase